MKKRQIVIIGAGLTGLTTAFFLKQKGLDVLILEEKSIIGGQIQTVKENGFIFESGPNTGILSYPEVVEMFNVLSPRCNLVTANEDAKKRLIWKGNQYHALPSGIISALQTPLFSWYDKFRILGEPFRRKGDDPFESVADLAVRRLGKSYLDYAVDPFLSGVYAGDPNKLITKFALPKLHNLEQQYGSFIKGSIAKVRTPKTRREKLATKKVFSAEGGLSSLVNALAEFIGKENILTSVTETNINYENKEQNWDITFRVGMEHYKLKANYLITTVGSYRLPQLLPFIDKEEMLKLNNLYYAPVVQAAVGFSKESLSDFRVFGGLVPSCEKKSVLGILNPSACFNGRTPEGGSLISVFIGGVRHPEYILKSDKELKDIISSSVSEMLGVNKTPDFIRIFRHEKAIPQYDISSGERFEAIDRVCHKYKGLFIKGNLCNGIGMADRIHQAYNTANEIAEAHGTGL
ncbi:MAG: protoporphyrinogen oxidase [Parabacteroides sp.]|nr:protoporphyrinogen oxidase [Parabacteroides sp.]